jgi:hypothetical protein
VKHGAVWHSVLTHLNFKPVLRGMGRRVMSLYQFSRKKNNKTATVIQGSTTFEALQG